MAQDCCEKEIPNTGVFDCFQKIEDAVGFLLMPLYNNLGVKNALTMNNYGVTPYSVEQIAMNQDPSMRIYPVVDMVKNPSIANGDAVYRDFTDGTQEHIRDGAYSVEFLIAGGGVSPVLAGNLDKVKCNRWGVFFVGSDGAIIGERSKTFTADKLVYPIELIGFMSQFSFANLEKKSEIMVKFDLTNKFKAETLYAMPADHFTTDITTLKGLKPVTLTMTSLAPSGAMVAINQAFSTDSFNANNVVGQTVSDFVVFNKTTGLEVVPVAVLEQPSGAGYTFTFAPNLTVGHVVDFKMNTLTSGLDGKITKTVV